MARTRYASDPGLIARMGATMFLLGLVFVGLVVGLFFLLDVYASHRGQGGSGSAPWLLPLLLRPRPPPPNSSP